ncbi:sphingosine-1-phosphate transporter SPNS2 isoform X3 [Equus asinus]|uniref:sphingosine-1-phosphate transporter SPNS2 isoform X3 n=1 Tax=Equus asinus TaxID=9793 RepID=UPI0038F72BEB
MMCLECASAAAGGAEEEEADAERRRRRRGAQRGAGGGGCCGARAPGATGVAAADDEVQTLSGSVRRAPAGPPSTPSTPSCAAAAKAPGAQQPKPASLGRGRGAAAAILSLGNVLNYLDRYTVAECCLGPGRRTLWAEGDSGCGFRVTACIVIVVKSPGSPRKAASSPFLCPLHGALLRQALSPPALLGAGVLLDIQQHFRVKDRDAGLLQSVFICSFMVAAPLFGYLGDRFNRKVILSCGIFFWSAVTFSSSFIPQQHFWLLVLSRGLVGIGEASYSTIAPTIIGDLFTKNTRTLMLSVFYFAIPLGSGLGYITGSSVKQAAGDWHWALRVSPILGMITGTLILVLVPATKRGHADQLGGQLKARTSWLRDMKALIRNRSYVFSSLATSAVSFATGALGMWIPLYLHRAQVVQKMAETCSSPPCGAKDSLIFGAITCFTGFLGVVTGAGATRWCRLRTQRADPLVCAVGMLGSAIFICLIFVAAKSSIVGAYICIFVGETLLFSNWAITADILMYVVIPTRRATAVALQSFTSHLLGDAGSPYLIGFGEPAGDAARIHESLRRCHWDNEEPLLSPSLGGVLWHPGPAGLSQSFLCDPQRATGPLWSGTPEWPWLQEEAVSSTNLEGCQCWSHMLGQTPGPRGPGRRRPLVGAWGEPGLTPAYVILGKSLPSPDCRARGLDFPTQLARHGTVYSLEDLPAPGPPREEVAQALEWHFRL